MKNREPDVRMKLVIMRGRDVADEVRYGFAIMFGQDVVGQSGLRFADPETASEAGQQLYEQLSGDVKRLIQAQHVLRVQHDVPEDF